MAQLIHLSKNESGDWDMVLNNGEFEMCEDGKAASVHCVERILLDRVETVGNPLVNTVKNPNIGTQWYGIIFQNEKPQIVKEFELRRVILGTPGIEAVTKWSWIEKNRILYLDIRLQTAWGDIILNEEIPL
jgi:hypothetical protein